MPETIPTFTLTSTCVATTYRFRCDAHGGWATCTINDATGELLIMSDWGNWSYRWNINHLGPSRASRASGWTMTLTEFVGDRTAGSLDYLANKLTSHDERQQFDAWETVLECRRRLLENRLEQGRACIEYYDEDYFGDDPRDEYADVGSSNWDSVHHDTRKVYCYGKEEHWPLTKGTTRSIYDQLGGDLDVDSQELFVERYFKIQGHEWITTEPWDLLQFRPGTAYHILLKGILPALTAAAGATWRAFLPKQPSISWAGDLELALQEAA